MRGVPFVLALATGTAGFARSSSQPKRKLCAIVGQPRGVGFETTAAAVELVHVSLLWCRRPAGHACTAQHFDNDVGSMRLLDVVREATCHAPANSPALLRRRCYALKHSYPVFLFNVSKVFEFVDTIFIVLRKKPLMFLHYYHHVVTMLFCVFTNQVGLTHDACARAKCNSFIFSRRLP